MRNLNNLSCWSTGLLLMLASAAWAPAAPAADLPPLAQATLEMRAGMRLGYLQAAATVGASGIRLVPDANGNWVNIYTQQVFSENAGSGGAGISLFDVYAFDTAGATPQAIVQHTVFGYNQAIGDWSFAPLGGVLVGNPAVNVDTLWRNPVLLNAQPDIEQPGLRVKRIRYVYDGRAFNAIRIQANGGTDLNPSWAQQTYDRQTGLLLIESRALQAANGTQLSIMRLLSGRAITLPGRGSVWPAALRKTKSYAWRATAGSSVAGLPGPTTQATVSWTQLAWTPRVLSFTQKTNNQAGGSFQQNIAGTVGSPWMPPAYLAQLRRGAILDAESAMEYRVQVGTVANGLVDIYQILQTDSQRFQYQLGTGNLVAVSAKEQAGPAIFTKSLSLSARR